MAKEAGARSQGRPAGEVRPAVAGATAVPGTATDACHGVGESRSAWHLCAAHRGRPLHLAGAPGSMNCVGFEMRLGVGPRASKVLPCPLWRAGSFHCSIRRQISTRRRGPWRKRRTSRRQESTSSSCSGTSRGPRAARTRCTSARKKGSPRASGTRCAWPARAPPRRRRAAARRSPLPRPTPAPRRWTMRWPAHASVRSPRTTRSLRWVSVWGLIGGVWGMRGAWCDQVD